jgi:LysR family transcriptional regulator, hydrogen peroxide-inducible genes activator
MEMHQLRYFVAVARTGTFSRAAGECHVAQPSLSQQIQKLESEVGERLFERTRRRAILTPAGALFLPHALSILETAEQGRQEIREMSGEIRGKILLGALPTIAPYFLPEIIRLFREKYRGVELIFHEETTLQLLRGLEENELDLALISDSAPNPRIRIENLFSEELLLCLPAGHVLVDQRVVVAADLQQEKFILMQEGHCLGAQAQRFCQSKGLRPQISCRSAQIATVVAMVQAGLGISLIPEMARQQGLDAGVIYRSLDGTGPRRTLALAMSRQRKSSRCVLEFSKFIRDHCHCGSDRPTTVGGWTRPTSGSRANGCIYTGLSTPAVRRSTFFSQLNAAQQRLSAFSAKPWAEKPSGATRNQHRRARRLSTSHRAAKSVGALEENCRHRPVQYLNNVLEQDHRAIKRRVRASQHFRSFWGAWRTIAGYEVIHMIRKGQACGSVGLLHHFILGLFAATN